MVKRSRRSPLKAESGVRFPLGVPCRRPYGRHFCCFLPRVPFLGFRQIPTQQNHFAVRTDGIFFTFGESHVTRLTLPCNNRYSVAPLLTIPLGGTMLPSVRTAFLLLSAEGPLLGFRQIPTRQLNPLLCPNIPNISAVKAGFPFLTQSGDPSGPAALSWLAYYSADLTFSISASRCFAAAILS